MPPPPPGGVHYLHQSRLEFADRAARWDCRAPPGAEPDRPGRPEIQPEDFGMGALVSPDSLAAAVQLPAQLRGSCLYPDHTVCGIAAGPERLRPPPHPVEPDGHAALGPGPQRDGRGDDYGGHRHIIQRISEHLLRAVLPRPGHVRRGVHLLQAQLRLGHHGCGRVRRV